MLPAWFTKLRDVKAASKQSKQQEKQHASPPRSSKKREAPASLAKSLSLRRASSKARNNRFESEIRDSCRDQDCACSPLSSNECNLRNDIQSVHDLQSSGLLTDSSFAIFAHHCRHQDGCNPEATSHIAATLQDLNSVYDGDQSGSNCKGNIVSKLVYGKGRDASTEEGHFVFDHDTEEFSLTSETSSFYGSEMSSSDSNGGSKCTVNDEKGCQGGHAWQEGFRKPDTVCGCEKDRIGSLGDKLLEEQKNVKMLSRLSEKTAEAQHSLVFDQLQEGRRCSLHTSSTISASSSANSDNGTDSSSSPSNNTPTQKSFSFIERKATGSSLRSDRDEGCALRYDPANEQQVAEREVPMELSGEIIVKGIDNSNLAFNIDEDDLGTSTPDKPNITTDEIFLHEERNTTIQCILGSPEMTARSTCNFFGKCSIVQMQRTRKRCSSISAVLPPDLQGVVGDSLAFVTISDDPYEDFRQSMYEMIMEKDLEGSMDVEELLYCYLTLNSPEHHELIEEVFSDVWSAILMKVR